MYKHVQSLVAWSVEWSKAQKASNRILLSKNFTLTMFSQKHLKIERGVITPSCVLAHVLQNWHANNVEGMKNKNPEKTAEHRENCTRARSTSTHFGTNNIYCTRTETARAPTAPDRGPAVLKLVRRRLGAFQPTACGPTPAPRRPLPI